ncbi:unnamed protein product [Brassica napus]|nr:unnamed protein product [Brassica napus]
MCVPSSEHYPTWTVEPPSDTLKQIIQICTDRTVVSQPETHPSDIHDEEDEEDEETEDEASIGVPWNRSEM